MKASTWWAGWNRASIELTRHLQLFGRGSRFPFLRALRESPHGPRLRPFVEWLIVNKRELKWTREHKVPLWWNHPSSRRDFNSGRIITPSWKSFSSCNCFFVTSSFRNLSVPPGFIVLTTYQQNKTIHKTESKRRQIIYVPEVIEAREPFFGGVRPVGFVFVVLLEAGEMLLHRTFLVLGHWNTDDFIIPQSLISNMVRGWRNGWKKQWNTYLSPLRTCFRWSIPMF